MGASCFSHMTRSAPALQVPSFFSPPLFGVPLRFGSRTSAFAERSTMPECMSVSEFVEEVQEDWSSPTTSSFTSKMTSCRNTVYLLEEVSPGGGGGGCWSDARGSRCRGDRASGSRVEVPPPFWSPHPPVFVYRFRRGQHDPSIIRRWCTCSPPAPPSVRRKREHVSPDRRPD